MSTARSWPPRPLRRSSRTPTPLSPVSATQPDDVVAGSPRESLADVMDQQGTPCAGQLNCALDVLESWTKRLEADQNFIDPAENERYGKFVEGLLRLARRDGSILLTDHETETNPRHAWRAAARLAEPRLQRLINGILRGGAAGRGSAKPRDLPAPSANSDEAGLAVLRPTWSSPRLVVDYQTCRLRLALDCGGELLVYGDGNPHLTVDGELLEPLSRWETTCWVTDDDVDYLELELSLSRDVRIQRHLVFAREDQFLVLADAVLVGQPSTIDYRLALPLADGVLAEGEVQTRETALTQRGRRRATVVPLGLSEWKGERSGDRRRGDLQANSGRLELQHSAANAGNLFAPWFIDLEPRRFSRAVTWRQLTVAEDRQIQPDDAAVGYRVQVGSRQWLFYRSLDACGNRTLLGHNLVSEFLAARFSRGGVPETLIEIEATADENE